MENIRVKKGENPLPREDLYRHYFIKEGVHEQEYTAYNFFCDAEHLGRIRAYPSKWYYRTAYGEYEPMPDSITSNEEAIAYAATLLRLS